MVAVSCDTPFPLPAVGVQPAGAIDSLEAVAALGPDLVVGPGDAVDGVLHEQLPHRAAGALLVAAGPRPSPQADLDHQDSGCGSCSSDRLSLLSDGTVLLCPVDVDGSIPKFVTVIGSLGALQQWPTAAPGHGFGLFWFCAVTDCVTATNALTEFAENVLTPIRR